MASSSVSPTKIGGSRIVILTEGKTDPLTAKTANVLLRYRAEDIVAILDSTQAGKRAEELLGVGGDTPIVGSLDEVDAPDTLLIGVATAGGKIPAEWLEVCHDAVKRGMCLVSGMHQFLSSDPQLSAAAAAAGVAIHDVRKNSEHEVATRQGIDERCLRVLTVGQDCSVGKMVAALEVARGLQAAGVDAKFVATGQTGIMVEGDGLPIDCVVSDFVNGAVENLVRANQHHEVMLFEGQATITHPRFSGVSAGLLHGCNPHGMILCYEAGRTTIRGMDHLALPTLKSVAEAYEHLAAFGHPAKIIGVAMNSRRLTADEAEAERARMRAEFQVPVADPIRHGPGELVDAVRALLASHRG
ncbi:DUF1611 domain-containing protein [Botrimarina hoheduenensis]|uniref:DUF1611 domain-containing protein n=1 Tax=Botrimarina hoheduenensis TaxID=2528000 RepID=A0A5C5WFG5_9BACT|nr:DUF1611 domain-containing protein [Botrimarina hoheduenensis]TWT48823.1 hypothetical protein Pla111_05990 [Botrimarina hoheduenensis]